MQTTHTDGSSAPSTGYHTLEKRHSFNGRGTYYQPDRGACGWVNSADDSIVAISVHQWDGGSHCGENIRVCHDGRCISVQVVDMCPSCHVGSLDFSPSAFSQLAPKSEGVIGIG
ncbi:hypothetical protein IE81DRAFT_313853 [Ceraceosorus guamensis]|nr:hypothetical protein IE81DRAFT_313853 [Ceraceosorus guamensis]PWN42305.1 hypothetical protein IE81DRAFT_313853 [Ceraceosorus guamensis]